MHSIRLSIAALAAGMCVVTSARAAIIDLTSPLPATATVQATASANPASEGIMNAFDDNASGSTKYTSNGNDAFVEIQFNTPTLGNQLDFVTGTDDAAGYSNRQVNTADIYGSTLANPANSPTAPGSPGDYTFLGTVTFTPPAANNTDYGAQDFTNSTAYQTYFIQTHNAGLEGHVQFDELDLNYNTASPEPACMGLLGLGALGLLGRRRRMI